MGGCRHWEGQTRRRSLCSLVRRGRKGQGGGAGVACPPVQRKLF